MGKLILARCGSTDFDDQDRILGTLDIPVNVRGKAEVGEMARDLREEKISLVYSSAGESARETAKALGDKLDVKVKVLDDLTNVDLGLWQGLPVAEVRRKHPKVFKQWEESPGAICPPLGETIDDVMERVRKLLKPVLRKSQTNTVVLVAPEPLWQIIRCHLLNTDPAHLLDEVNGKNWEAIPILS